MPSTITVSWSGPGNLTARHYYYVPSVANPENPVIWYYVETTGAQWTTNSTITLPANCVIYNLKISNSNGAVGQSVTIFGYQMNATGKGGIINTLNNKVKNSSWTGSESVTATYSYSGNPAKPTRTMPAGSWTDLYCSYTQSQFFSGVSLEISYYTAEEIEQGFEPGGDAMPDEVDGRISFIIEPYGENRQRYGTAIGGAPTSQSEVIPSFDCYIPTTFTDSTTMAIDNDNFIYQLPIWYDVQYTDFKNGFYSDDNYPLQYCCINGSVYFRGWIRNTNTSWTQQSVIFTLPEGFRPTSTTNKNVYVNISGSKTGTKAYAIIQITPAGDVKYLWSVNFATYIRKVGTGANTYLSMDAGFRK